MSLMRRRLGLAFIIFIIPVLLSAYFLQLWQGNLSLPFIFDKNDGIWTLVLSKFVFDTGWVLNNPYLAAPDTAHWYANAAAQTSALHSVAMLVLKPFSRNSIAMQQSYFVISSSLITLTSYVCGRVFGMHRLVSCMMGLIFAFSTYRWYNDLYSFLPNYYMIPLAFVPVFWIASGRFAPPPGASYGIKGILVEARRLMTMKSTWLSVIIVALTATSDGYYAFFTLLMIGFATLIALLNLDRGRIYTLAIPVLLGVVLISTVTALVVPLLIYKAQHPSEWLLHGLPDPDLSKRPFEAEVYSSTLKFLVAPSEFHRIPALADLGRWIISTSIPARALGIGAETPLGMLGTFLLLGFGIAAVGAVVGRRQSAGVVLSPPREILFRTALLFVAFILLSSTWGGVGSLIALVYPEIRAYNRFPIFLIFTLLFGAGLVFSSILEKTPRPRRIQYIALAAVVTICAIWDQAPVTILQRKNTNVANFKAEQRDVISLESMLPKGAMVYQYPYSQYISENHYYEWGSFYYLRLYLHSHFLHWSNGAARNSPADLWHVRLASLPPEQLVKEVRAAGFQALVVDRAVVHDDEYGALRDAVVRQTGTQPVEHADSQLAYWILPPETTRIVFGSDFKEPSELVVTDPTHVAPMEQSRFVDPAVLSRRLDGATSTDPITLTRDENPDLFLSAAALDQGLGEAVIKPLDRLQGDVECPAIASGTVSPDATINLVIRNRSAFDWRMNSGPNPIRVGLRELLDRDGRELQWDGGYRVPDQIYLPKDASATVKVPLSKLGSLVGKGDVTAVFALVQDGNAWFGANVNDGICRVSVRKDQSSDP